VNPTLAVVNDLGSHDCIRRSRIPSIPSSLLIVNQSPRHFGPPYQAKPLEWAVERMQEYSSFVFVSERCRGEWVALGAAAGKPTFRVPNCCDEDAVERLRRESRADVRSRLGLPSDRLVAVCVATIQYRKGQDIIVDQFPRLAEVAPDLEVHFIGAPVPGTDWVLGSVEYATRVRDAARASPYGDRIPFVGAKRNALDYIYAADLLILPARAEAMPLTILEAMALGTPVIASNVDGIPEMIEHGVSGLLFDPAHPKGFVDAMATMAESSATREALASRAHDRYWSQFSRDRVRQGYGRVVDALRESGLAETSRLRAPSDPPSREAS
jgi:glycosyltransferase involved in cell wall biosynthesis